MKKYVFVVAILLVPGVFSSYASAVEVEEITVYGTRPQNPGFATLGSWMSFSITAALASDRASRTVAIQAVANVVGEVEPESPQECQAKINAYRVDCKFRYDNARYGCLMTGAFFTGAFIIARIPPMFRSVGSISSAGATGVGCNTVNHHAKLACDALADSNIAPILAGCEIQI